jgi:hypothetical protein
MITSGKEIAKKDLKKNNYISTETKKLMDKRRKL